MKNFISKLAILTAIAIFVTSIFAQTSVSDQIFIALIITMPLLIMYMVYKVLKDDHRNNKTFIDWYSNYPGEGKREDR